MATDTTENNENAPPMPKTNQKASIEKIYQKKSQLEHILLRPDTYVGSVEKATELMWVYDKEKDMILQKEITYVPGLYKIFDEILVNAADNKQRDPKMDTIKIEINADTNSISVYNNGSGIPIAMHKDEKMYVPTMIFGHLLTSSNYNDEEEKVTGGRNGYGAKLCNIFSTKFTVDTASKKYKKVFKQTWGSNMGKASEPKIKDSDKGEDYTKIIFSPDLGKFGMDKLDEDIVSLMSRRAYDVAASTGVKVYLNGKRLPVSKLKDYINMYIKGKEDENGSPLKICFQHVSERWQVACTLSDRGFQQTSFVNSIATTKGGKHVDHIADMIVKKVIVLLKKKNKGGVDIKPFQVKNHMWIFVNCLIVNPSFDSQTKENMTLQVKNFGSKCNLSDEFINAIGKCGIVEAVLNWAKFKAQSELAKTSGKKQSKPKDLPSKLVEANDAGTRNAHLCTLIVTEGDSAKTLAVAGLSVVGQTHYGVFPLKGKPLNVRDASHKQVLENAEINSVIKILGLVYKKKYLTMDDLKTLRYGKLMIMADQDQDGSHIKGLVINFIHHNWPDLLKLPFLEEFITPIVKASKKGKEISFYSLPEFEEWKSGTPNQHTFNIKYYKGLGTSTSKEAKEYFQNMERHRIPFKYSGSLDDRNIELAFSKKAADQRKEWLTNFMDETKRRKEIGLNERYLYTKDLRSVTYSDFINLELVLFSNGDNIRSIPSMIDGFKPGQRKVIFTCIKRNDKREVKVAQLAGSVAEHSAYHHGEASLCATIVNLAQNHVGSNNINLLEPRGQFGSRLEGGKDSASARYIFTKMSPITRLIFHPHDDPLLTHEYDDNQRIQPIHYMPIIPMVLVNGAEGIGTGWSTKIPSFNPRDIVKNIRRMLDGEEPFQMHPWYKNFKGTVEPFQDKYVISGEAAILPEHETIEITELPVGTWTHPYKANVIMPMYGNEKIKPTISSFQEHVTDVSVRYVVKLLPGKLSEIESDGVHKVFKLQTTISLNVMNAFDENGCLKRYEKVEDILKEFYELRMKYYVKRKSFLLGQFQAEVDKISNQARFIVEKCDKDLVVENKKRKALIEELKKRGYASDPVEVWKKRVQKELNIQEDEQEESESEKEEEETAKGDKPIDSEKAFAQLKEVKMYNYLLGMSMWMLTKEKKDELLKKKDQKLAEMSILKAKTPTTLWKDDLDAFISKLDELEDKERKEELETMKKSFDSAKRTKNKHQNNLKDFFPSSDGSRVEPRINDDLMKRILAAEKLKLKKEIKKEYDPDDPSGISPVTSTEKKTKAPKVKKEKTDKEDKSDGMKQTKLTFKKESPEKGKKNKKKKAISDSEDDINMSGSDFSIPDPPVEQRQKVNRRAATKVNTYSQDSDNKSDSEPELFDNEVDDKNSYKPQAISDSDSDMGINKRNGNSKPLQIDSDNLFDSLIQEEQNNKPEPVSKAAAKTYEISDSDSDAAPPPVAEAPKKATTGNKRKLFKTTNAPAKRAGKANSDVIENSDSDSPFVKKKPKTVSKKPKKMNQSGSDSDDFVPDSDSMKSAPAVKGRAGGRAKKPTKYAQMSSSDGDDY
ncbi:DNA topoisomerase 2 isoform X2 [Arctopsyche grandis]